MTTHPIPVDSALVSAFARLEGETLVAQARAEQLEAERDALREELLRWKGEAERLQGIVDIAQAQAMLRAEEAEQAERAARAEAQASIDDAQASFDATAAADDARAHIVDDVVDCEIVDDDPFPEPEPGP